MRTWIAAIVAAAAAATAYAGATATCPTQPATATSEVLVTAEPPPDPAVVKILDDHEAASKKHATIRADVEYVVDNPVLGDTEKRTGWVAYLNDTDETPAMIRIHFDTVSQDGGATIREKVDYAFDGEWATIAKHNISNMLLTQLSPPGKKIRALRLGKGPLPPLPFGQRRQDVLEHFMVQTRPTKESEPPDTVYLKLTTRRQYRGKLSFLRLEMWLDKNTLLPVRIISEEPNSNRQTIKLKNVRTNEKFEEGMFRLSTRGWKTVRVEPYKE